VKRVLARIKVKRGASHAKVKRVFPHIKVKRVVLGLSLDGFFCPMLAGDASRF
jgi:hypothetical protein